MSENKSSGAGLSLGNPIIFGVVAGLIVFAFYGYGPMAALQFGILTGLGCTLLAWVVIFGLTYAAIVRERR